MGAHSSAEPRDWDWNSVSACCLAATRRVLGAGPEAEDAAQDATLIAWRLSHQCRKPDDPWAWTAAIARREALKYASRPRNQSIDASLELAAPTEESERIARLDVRRALEELSVDEQRLLHARYWQDLTQEQVAQALGLPDGTVKIRLHRLRQRLKPILMRS